MLHNNDSEITQELYKKWCEAELYASQVFDEVNEDDAHPRYVEVYNQSNALLLELLKPSCTLHGALVKLKIALYCEGYLNDIEDPQCTAIAPRAIVAAIQDLENILGNIKTV